MFSHIKIMWRKPSINNSTHAWVCTINVCKTILRVDYTFDTDSGYKMVYCDLLC